MAPEEPFCVDADVELVGYCRLPGLRHHPMTDPDRRVVVHRAPLRACNHRTEGFFWGSLA